VRRFPALALLAATAGCIPRLQMVAPDVQVARARLVVAPVDVEVLQPNSGVMAVRADWTDTAIKNVNAAVARLAAANRVRTVREEDLLGPEVDYWRFRRWSEDVMTAIALHRMGRTDSRHQSVAEWRYGRALVPWQAKLDADFLLLVQFREGRGDTRGNGGQQSGVACVVQLSDGRVVWCYTVVDPGGDLRRTDLANGSVNRLLEALLAVPLPPPRKRVGGNLKQ
jgi:hypothetical protein